MTIITFSEKLIKPVAKLCRQNMELDIMPDFLLKEKIFGDDDYREDLTLCAFEEDQNEPVGFIQGVIKDRGEEKIAYIKLLAVDSNFRRKGIASKLYKNIEEKFREKNIKKIRVYESYPNYFMPGVDPFYTEAVCFFEKHNFEKFSDTTNLNVNLLAQDFETDAEEKVLEKNNIFCRRAGEDDKEKVFEWLDKNFSSWRGEVTEAYKNDLVTLFICTVNDEIKAFSAHEANNKGTGWFGPMGTDKSLRGKGIGGILLRKCLKDMKDMGYVKAAIPWVGPIPFYMHYANARVERVFWRYEKKME